MADWKQITARIRRARTGKDPAGQLTNLFTKTRDAMVAFELARYLESIGNSADAGRWYLTAAERFRRSDWKTKAQESATRLGATAPAEVPAELASPLSAPPESQTPPEAPVPGESAAEENDSSRESSAEPETASTPASTAAPATAPVGRRRGRGRRGGRDHQRERAPRPADRSSSPRESRPIPPAAPRSEPEDTSPRAPLPPRSLDSMAELSTTSLALRGRSGDPGLSSRLSQLEMNFRRLLAGSPAKLDDAAHAPAGPGVWVLTDEDLSTYYYVEACQTLRVAIGQLLRGSARYSQPIKPQLAEHLGIPETRVAKYLSDHCVVRWLQMDDGAAHFAHFLIAVLHPALNE
jgi:hypothetical protein